MYRCLPIKDLIIAIPEITEKFEINPRALDEADNEAQFLELNNFRETKRLKATCGLAEIERNVQRLWRALLPNGKHKENIQS